ncbi:flagellar assembly protein FliH [Bradyrhizobium sp. JR3.5]
MAAPAKFLFDTDFSAPDRSRERAPTPAEVAQKVADAEARAYRAGYEAALREAKVESDRRAAQALEEIGTAIKGIAARFAGIETRMETEAVDVAVAVARKLCSELVAREPLGEITALVSDCFSHLVATPHLVVRINDALYEAAHDNIERVAAHSGFQGRAGHPRRAHDCDGRLPDRMGRRRRGAGARRNRRQDQRTRRALSGVPQPGRLKD